MLLGNRAQIQELEAKIQENDRELAKLRVEKSDALSEIETLKQEVAVLTQTIADYKEQEESYLNRIDNEIRLKLEAVEEAAQCKKKCEEMTIEYSSLKAFYRQKVQEADEQQEKLTKQLAYEEAAARNALAIEIENGRKEAQEKLKSQILRFSDNYYRCFAQIQELFRAMSNEAADTCSTCFLADETAGNGINERFQKMQDILSGINFESANTLPSVLDEPVPGINTQEVLPLAEEVQPLIGNEIPSSLSESNALYAVEDSAADGSFSDAASDESFSFPTPASLSDRFRSAIAGTKNT